MLYIYVVGKNDANPLNNITFIEERSKQPDGKGNTNAHVFVSTICVCDCVCLRGVPFIQHVGFTEKR